MEKRRTRGREKKSKMRRERLASNTPLLAFCILKKWLFGEPAAHTPMLLLLLAVKGKGVKMCGPDLTGS